MAKKAVKKEKELIIPIESEGLKTDISNYQATDKELELGVRVIPMEEKECRNVEENPDFVCSKKTLSNISMEELIAYKNGCELVCKHYENISRLDNIGYHKFNEFQAYANMVFNEIEKRVKEICN